MTRTGGRAGVALRVHDELGCHVADGAAQPTDARVAGAVLEELLRCVQVANSVSEGVVNSVRCACVVNSVQEAARIEAARSTEAARRTSYLSCSARPDSLRASGSARISASVSRQLSRLLYSLARPKSVILTVAPGSMLSNRL
jgi:hypothetical protein